LLRGKEDASTISTLSIRLINEIQETNILKRKLKTVEQQAKKNIKLIVVMYQEAKQKLISSYLAKNVVLNRHDLVGAATLQRLFFFNLTLLLTTHSWMEHKEHDGLALYCLSQPQAFLLSIFSLLSK
jgi:hypothetical protein